MKKIIVLCIIYWLNLSANAQMTAGITGIKDTSYSTNSAYLSTRKSHPDITIVPEIKSPLVKDVRGIVYCNLSGRNLLLDAFCPVVVKSKRPAIIIIHGGGWRSGNRSQHYPLAQTLATKGYACFTPEYRLSTEALYPAAVHDLKAVIRWVRQHADEYNVDTAAVTVLGFSAGGELAAFLGVTGNMKAFEGTGCNNNGSTAVQAVIDLDGTLSFVHPESGEGNDSKGPSAGTYWFGYSKKDNYALWESASPLTYVGKDAPPTLFINSAVERMHAGRGDYISILSKYNTYSEVHTFDGAPHSFPLFQPWFDPMVKYMDDFMKKVFPG
jgi:pectinesterase